MKVNSFNCIVCHFPFDDSTHLPRILDNCSHSVCSLCLSKSSLTKSKTFICPKDNIIYSNAGSIENFEINQEILNNIIEENKNNNEEIKLTKKDSKKSIKSHKTLKTKLDIVSFSDTLQGNNNIIINNDSNINNNINTNKNININNSNINNIYSPKCYIKKPIKFYQNKKINLADNSLLCSTHSLPLNIICINDRQKICGQCALNNLHLEHQVISEQKFIEYIDELVKIYQEIEKNQNDNNKEENDIKTNIILEKLDNKIARSKHKIKNICIELIENINFQFRQIDKYLDLRKNEIFSKFKSINYNIKSLKESANKWMEIISSKLNEANRGSIDDINLDILKLLDKNENIFNLINTGKQLNERYNFIQETKGMIEKLNKFSQNGLNIIPNNAIIDTLMTLTVLNESSPRKKLNGIPYGQNVLTTMDNKDRNNIYKNVKLNFNFINKNNFETPLFKIEEDKDLIDGLHLTNIGGLYERIKNTLHPKAYEDSSQSEREQSNNAINNLSNVNSGININNFNTSHKMSNNKIYSKKKLDDFYSKEYIINFKNLNDNKAETQTNFNISNTHKREIEFFIKKTNNEEQSSDNKFFLSDTCPRYNTQFCNNLENVKNKNNIISSLSPISKKDLFPKLKKEKVCDISFITSKKKRYSNESLALNNDINGNFKLKTNYFHNYLNTMTLSPQSKSIYNIMNNNMTNIFPTQQEIKTVEKYENKKNNNFKSNSANKRHKNKHNTSKNKFTRCISCSSSLINRKEIKDIPILFNNNKDKKNNNKELCSPPKKVMKDDINEISTTTNQTNKNNNNEGNIKKTKSSKSININNKKNNSVSNAFYNNINNKNISYIIKNSNELKELIDSQMKKINPCFNHINMKGEGLQMLFEYFQKNKNQKYKELKLIGSNLNDEDFSLFIKNIVENEIEIGTLNATYNQISDNSFKFILEMIKKVKGIKNIFLYNNRFSKGFKNKIKNYDRKNSLYNVRLYL